MSGIRESPWIRYFVVPFVGSLWLGVASCTSWKTQDQPVRTVLEAERPYEVKVGLSTGETVHLSAPRVLGDSLVGLRVNDGGDPQGTRFAVPLGDVMTVEVREGDAVKTTALVVGIGALVVGGAVLIANAAEQEPPPPKPSTGGEPISCPLVYSWDGNRWRLDSGTFGGAFLTPLARTDIHLLEHARVEDGVLRLRLANELPETDHVDAFRLLVVDHEPGTEVIPSGDGALHAVGTLSSAARAVDDRSRDAGEAVRTIDGWGWESSPAGRDTAVDAEVRSGLTLVFERPSDAERATLVVHGSNTAWAGWMMREFVAAHGRETDRWYAALNADPAGAKALGTALAAEALLSVSVWTEQGWEPRGAVWEAGPEIAKRQAIPIDLSDVPGDTVQVRLESVPLYWNLDQVAIAWTVGPEPTPLVLEPTSARLEADKRDVSARLSRKDGVYLVLETGEAAELSFTLPPPTEGLERSLLIATTGWYRIHSPQTDAPPRPELTRIGSEPLAVSRLSVARLNEALRALAHRSESGVTSR
jgi:hypothetical protein